MLDVRSNSISGALIFYYEFSFQEIAEFENFAYGIIFVFLELDYR